MKTYTYGDPASGTVLLQPVDDHDLSMIESEVSLIRESAGDDFCLTALRVGSWNDDLSPWKAQAVFGNEGFGGRAQDTLDEILSFARDKGKRYYIGGYSLAGLFALWAVYHTEIFAGAAAASPSVWFPGFLDHMETNAIKTGKVYLSLGDKEEKTRNPAMAKVGDCIREGHALLVQQGIRCVLEWNEGNHFREADRRTAKAFAWLMR